MTTTTHTITVKGIGRVAIDSFDYEEGFGAAGNCTLPDGTTGVFLTHDEVRNGIRVSIIADDGRNFGKPDCRIDRTTYARLLQLI